MTSSLETITDEALRPFGTLLRFHGKTGFEPARHIFDAEAGTQPDAFLIRTEEVWLPLRIEELECHPFTAQTFVPLTDGSSVVVVCLSAADGSPDPASLRAFHLPASIGITYGRGVWHHRLSTLEPSELLVIMSRVPEGHDTEIARLAKAVVVGAG